MRILLMAPFERDRQHGGSQRATAMAERLEERGAEVVWQVFEGTTTTMLQKLRGDLMLEPALLRIYPAGEPPARGSFDAVISSHSYLSWHLESFDAPTVRMIDFHNLEWRTLENLAAGVTGIRAWHPQLQVTLMRRFERRAIAACDMASFASEEELAWAADDGAATPRLLAPSVLPRAAEQQALQVYERVATRAARSEDAARLAYVGSLDFHPNMRTLMRFLERDWPAIRHAVPEAALTIAGSCPEEERRTLSRFPGVEALGFVEDIVPLLARSTGVVLPVDGWGGTSLRALYYALAGIRVIGPPAAFRGLPWEMGAVVNSPEQWAGAVAAAVGQGSGAPIRVDAARSAALALQRDDEPWDRLARTLSELRSARS